MMSYPPEKVYFSTSMIRWLCGSGTVALCSEAPENGMILSKGHRVKTIALGELGTTDCAIVVGMLYFSIVMRPGPAGVRSSVSDRQNLSEKGGCMIKIIDDEN
jgi:hypothetical protein